MASDMEWSVRTIVAIAIAVGAWSGPSAARAASTAPAQEADRAEQTEQFRQRLEEVRARLDLTDEQVEQVRPILRAGLEAQLERSATT